MADTSHTPEMTSFDNVTVVLYRTGIVFTAVILALKCIDFFTSNNIIGNLFIPLLATGTALSSANIHLYDHRFRYLIPLMSWIALVIIAHNGIAETNSFLLETISQGFLFAGVGMFALKEDFCFKIPGLKTVPLFLVASVFLHFFKLDAFEIYALIPASILMLVLSIAKWRMPLHFDVGDKSRYSH